MALALGASMRLKKSVDKSVNDEIKDSIEHYSRWWRIHDWCASASVLSSVVFSFIAGINAAHPSLDGSRWRFVLPSLPAFLITLERTLKMAAKAKWHWDMVLEYQALQRCLERGEITPEDASRRISEIEAGGDSKYPMLSSPA